MEYYEVEISKLNVKESIAQILVNELVLLEGLRFNVDENSLVYGYHKNITSSP